MERQTDQWDLVIKVKHGDTLRRIGAYVHGQLMDLNMSRLRSMIISLFKISHDAELILTYTDEDGDVVTLDDDDELRDAVIGQRLNPLRINVQLKSHGSSDARPERSSPSSSVNAPRPVILPTVDEQENTLPELLLGVVSNLVGIAQRTSSSKAFAQIVDDVNKCEPFRSTMESLSKDVKKAMSFSPALAQVVEHLSNLGLSNAGRQSSGPSCETSGVPSGASPRQMDLNVSEEPKDSNGPILEDIELPSDMAGSADQIPKENVSGNVVVHGAGVVEPSVATENGEASLNPMDDLLSSICTANSFPEDEGCNTNLDGKSGIATDTAFRHAKQALHGSGNYLGPKQLVQLVPTIGLFGSITYDGTILISEDDGLPGDVTCSVNQIPNENGSGNVVVQGAGVMSSCADRNAGATENGKASLDPVGDSLASICTAINLRMSEGTKARHRRMPWGFPSGVQCDGCGMHPIVGPRFKSNVKEAYDLCNICFTQMGKGGEYTRMDHANPCAKSMWELLHDHNGYTPSNVLHGCGVRPQRTKLGSRFVRDVTVLDGAVMPPSTRFTKIWRMRNDGGVTWPVGTRLVWVGGDRLGDGVAAHLEITQSGVPVEEELDVAVELSAPSRPGVYGSYWRMESPGGQEFGQRVWVLIQVGYFLRFSDDVPLDSGFAETNFSGTNGGWVEGVVEDVSGGHVEQPAQVAGGLMDAIASNDELSRPAPAASYGLQATPSDDGNHVEQALLKEMEEMGFKQIERRLNEYVLERDLLLAELKEMGFNDKELNKELLTYNGGSIKRTVLDLVAGKASE